MSKETKNKMSRRDALRFLGVGAGVVLAGCQFSPPPGGEESTPGSEGSVPNEDVELNTAELMTGNIEVIYRAEGALDYPMIVIPNPDRESVFPDVPKGDREALVRYESSFEDGDYFEDGKGDVDVPQYYYRVMTAGEIQIPELSIDLQSTDKIGSLAIIINHFGETAMWRDATVDNGFTVAGRVFNMSNPGNVTEASQALLDHYIGRMTRSQDGANCGVIDACQEVEWTVAIVGNGEPQLVTTGVYDRSVSK